MQNLKVIAQLMLQNNEDYCEIQENARTILLGQFHENGKDVIYVCNSNDSCDMDNWIKLYKVI